MTQGLSTERAERAGTVQPGEEMSQGDLVNVYTYLMGGSKEYRVRIFTVLPSQRTRGSRHKLKYNNFFLNLRKNIFTVTVVNTKRNRNPYNLKIKIIWPHEGHRFAQTD